MNCAHHGSRGFAIVGRNDLLLFPGSPKSLRFLEALG